MYVKIGKYPKKPRGERKVDVVIYDHDLWNADATLALVIHPLLVAFRNDHCGGYAVANEDVPEELRRPDGTDPYEQDLHYFDRFKWVLDEMIWAFGQYHEDWEDQYHVNNEFDFENWKKHSDRMQNGFRLFGTYYQCLWN